MTEQKASFSFSQKALGVCKDSTFGKKIKVRGEFESGNQLKRNECISGIYCNLERPNTAKSPRTLSKIRETV